MRGLYSIFMILLLIPLILPLVYAEFIENSLIITLSASGMASVTEKINPRITVSSINIPSISNKISNVLATDEKEIVLSSAQNGNMIRIDTLGASHVTLTYHADILNKTSGIWNLAYNSDIQSTITLPSISDIISVNNVPIDIKNGTVIMPPGQVSLSYVVRNVTANNFVASWDNLNYPVKIITASNIGNFSFQQNSKSIMFSVDNNAPVLVIVPKSLLGGPYDVELNGNVVESKQYYQNSTHSWLRIDPPQSGSVKIVGSTAIPEFLSIPLLIFVMGTMTIILIGRNRKI